MEQITKIRLGIFGLGRGASFLEIVRANEGEVVALCDKDEKKLAEAKSIVGEHAQCFTDFDAFLEADMDAVFLSNYFPEHAPYAVRCLEKGLHVLSECLSNVTMADGVALVRAAEKSSGIYMLAENYPYMQFNQEMRRVVDGGTLGKILFAEGEYNHPIGPDDTEFIKWARPYEHHWRNYLPRTYYITHALAPVMYITGATPRRVTAFGCFHPFGDEYRLYTPVGDRAAIITCLNDDDSVFRVTGCAAFGAHDNAYRVCCENGQIENQRGTDGRIMLRYNPWSVPEGMECVNNYQPEWQDKADAEAIERAGHGGGDYFVIKNFFKAIREGRQPEFDVYFATTTASVGILAHRSMLEGGKPYDIPDFHDEAARKQYENDRLTPFYDGDNEPTLPCCSHPDFRPSETLRTRYHEIIDN